MERFACWLFILVLLATFLTGCRTGDDDDDNNDDNNDSEDDDNDSDDEAPPPSGDPQTVLAVSRGQFLVFYNLYDVQPPPELIVDTDDNYTEQIMGGLTGDRIIDLAAVPASSVETLTERIFFDVNEARLASDNKGFVHLVYTTLSDNRLVHGTNSSGAWQEKDLPVEANESIDKLRLVIDSRGEPHLFYRTDSGDDYCLRHLHQSTAAWKSECILEEIFSAYNVAIDPDDTLHIAVRRDKPTATILYGSNPNGNWTWATALSMYMTYYEKQDFAEPQIDITASGRPAVAVLYYGETYNQLVTHVWYGEGTGLSLALGKVFESAEYMCDQIAMTMNPTGEPLIAITGEESQSISHEGNEWQSEPIAFCAEDRLRMLCDAHDRVHLVGYGTVKPTQQSSVLYQRWNDGAWGNLLRIGADGFSIGRLTMFLDSQSVPQFCAGLRYGIGPAGSWWTEKIELHNPNSMFHNFLLDDNDQPHLLYVPHRGIAHAYRSDGQWIVEDLYEEGYPKNSMLDDDASDDDCIDDDTDPGPYAGSLDAEWAEQNRYRLVFYSGWRDQLELLAWTGEEYMPTSVFAFPSHQTHQTQILVDSDDNNHIFLRRHDSMEYITDASGEWVHEEFATDFNQYDPPENYFHAVIDDNDVVHLAFYDQSEKALGYVTGVAGNWDLTYPAEGTKCKGPRVIFDAEQTVHILCQSPKHLTHFVPQNNGWSTEEIPVVADEANFDCAIDDEGIVHLLYEFSDALLFTYH